MLAELTSSRFVAAVLALFLLVGGNCVARSAELIMFEQSFCGWCEVWEKEVGSVYPMTSEGKKVPIRKVNIHAPRPADLEKLKPVIYTPTFVLVHKGSEVGRILGYPGEDHFWGLLDSMLERLPADD